MGKNRRESISVVSELSGNIDLYILFCTVIQGNLSCSPFLEIYILYAGIVSIKAAVLEHVHYLSGKHLFCYVFQQMRRDLARCIKSELVSLYLAVDLCKKIVDLARRLVDALCCHGAMIYVVSLQHPKKKFRMFSTKVISLHPESKHNVKM